ncbi:U3 small nucleolar RNA-associated protein [Colletotrichum orchidophilum]|uniref:U3 small nucleolar RNA-associated protein n=1 Tax=Colletotrichum orchidophilum TaxID=1209926 RepID=A0A1G4BI70_9PEZI|nr:U3 small nucleolar RNA-associated protein [Colletotrichum orchidophilum]OHF01129.1 U3 small nucleolar RNA-associated protein [Colletotrichum orchidophilum]
MDLHRCRFVPYPPSAINALAFSHPFTRSKAQSAASRLAVGRANGDIEIWNPLGGSWLQETVLRSGADRSVDGLVWANDPDADSVSGGRSRLFSIGYTSAVTEWDLETGRPMRHASGQHGDIWCLAAQPPASPSDPVKRLVAGTIDGMLAMYSIEDNDLRFQRMVVKSPSKKAQMVSVAFQSRHIVVVGCSNSTICAYDTRNGNKVRTMALGADLAGGAKDIIVWSVKVLPSGDIVSADSTGQVCIWDGKTYTQMQRIQSHKQDVLSLATSADGTAIMSGGMDRRTVLYKKTSGGSGARWGKVWSRKYHEHDVKAMASFESNKMSVVISGGPDASPVVLPFKELGRENHRTLSGLPQSPPLTSAPSARMVVGWWDREIHIWKLQKSFDGLYGADGADADASLENNRKLLKTILVKGESNITSAAITADGSFLVAATGTDVKAFHLQHHNPTKPSDVKLASVAMPKAFSNGASKIILSPNGNYIAAVQKGSKVLVAKVVRGDDDDDNNTIIIQKPRVVRRLDRKTSKQQSQVGLGNYERNITQLVFSPDSRMLASADLTGYIDTWVLGKPQDTTSEDDDEAASASSDSEDSSNEDDMAAVTTTTSSESWIRNPRASLMPRLPAPPVVLSFSDETVAATDGATTTDYTLVAVTTAWHILAFHPVAGALTSWSRRNPISRLPTTIRDTRDLAKGLLWQGSRIWIYGVSFLFMLDLSQDLGIPTGSTDPETALVPHQAGTKRKRRGGPESGAGARMDVGAIVPHQVDRFVGSKAGKEWQDDIEKNAPKDEDAMDVDGDSADDNDEEEEEEGHNASDSEGGELAALRNRNRETQTEAGAEGKTRWWYTYKYRPILGIAPLSSGAAGGAGAGAGAGADGDETDALEAVLVERPIWEVDLPARYFGAKEWER